jgi:glutaredoxin/Na+-transporting methylmalonyl-CoA/oxaloacetate decarboxylase gamma subunit
MSVRRTLLLAITALVALLGATVTPAWAADDPPPGEPPTIVLFHGEGCPHCAAERAFLADLLADRPDVVLEEHEVWNDADNADLLLKTAQEMGFEAVGVPVTIIGERVWIGFDDATGAEIAAAIGTPPTTSAPPPPSRSTVDVPLLGPVDTSQVSLLAATLAIGFVDGINPCSLWVLSLLLAMVLTAGMYALYMLGMYSAASYLSGMAWLRVVVAVIAGTFGVLQLKDGLGFTRGPSLSIPTGQRPGIYSRMRRVATPEGALATTLAGTVVLAVAVSLLETPCTAGLPLLWTTMLADQAVGFAEAAGLFAVYMLVFLLDEFLVFAAVVLTLRAARLQERQGRALKLVAGSVLLVLAATMLLAPAALTTVVGTVVVFAVAAVLAVVLYVVSSGRSASKPSSASVSSTSRTTEKATDDA